MQKGQEWRTENSNRNFPFLGDGSVPKDFISDIKFFYNRRIQSPVYLSSVSFDSTNYTLTFRYTDGNDIAISGTVPKNHGKNVVHIFGENQESLVMFCTGSWWDSQTSPFSASFNSTIDPSLTTSGTRTIRRIIIDGSNDPSTIESNWRRESTQSIIGGINIILSKENEDEIQQVDNSPIYISADDSRGFIEEGEPETGITTINGTYHSGGNFLIGARDCLAAIENPNLSQNTLKIKSDCLPCCGCSSYQRISNAITHRSNKLSELCDRINQMMITSSEQYNAAVIAVYEAARPVARIRSIRVYQNRVLMALQNVCALPIYGRYGVSFSGVTMANLSPPSVIPTSLAAPQRFNEYENLDSDQIPSGTFNGILGPISPGGYVDLVFSCTSCSPDQDLRRTNFTISTEANGYFGQIPTMGCKKDQYMVEVSEDNTTTSNPCNNSEGNVRYRVTEIDIP
jgi:hypothetical protein